MTKRTSTTMLFQRNTIGTPIGCLWIISDHAGQLRAVDWQDHEPRLRKLLARHYPAGFELQDASAATLAQRAFEAYFEGDLSAVANLPVQTGGSQFQRDVWRALRTIPLGTTCSYGGLAQQLGRPGAMRAVGLANGANPINIAVPCHRVIGASGALTGYGGGIERKRWLLQHEGVSLRAEQRALEARS